MQSGSGSRKYRVRVPAGRVQTNKHVWTTFSLFNKPNTNTAQPAHAALHTFTGEV
jgi:hypothetical protein